MVSSPSLTYTAPLLPLFGTYLVIVICLLGRDVTVLQVLRHLLPRSFPRIPVAAPVPRHQAHDVVLLEAQACHLAEHLLMPVFADDLYVVARPFLPAGHAPGRELVPPEGRRQEGFIRDDAVVQHHALTPTILAGAAVLVVEGVAFDQHAVSRLRDLDGDVVRLPVADAELAVLSVLVVAGSPAAYEGLDEEEKLSGVRVSPGEDGTADGEEVPGGKAVGYVRCEGFPQEVDGVPLGLPVRRDRGGTFGGEDGVGRAHYLQGPEHCPGRRQVRGGEGLEAGANLGDEPRPGAVDRPGHLRVAAGEVADELVVGDGDLDPHREGSVADSVVVDPVLRLEDAPGELRELQTGHPLAVVEQVLHRVEYRSLAVPPAEIDEAPLADPERGDAGPQVAEGHVRESHVGRDQIQQCLVRLSLVEESYVGELEAFLVHLGGVGGPGARVLTPHLRPVGLVGHEGHYLTLVEDRHDERDVGEVRTAALVRVVGDEDVAGVEPVTTELLEHARYRAVQRAQKSCNAVTLGYDVAPGIGGAHCVVEGLVDDGALARSLERVKHLVSQRDQGVLDYLQSE